MTLILPSPPPPAAAPRFHYYATPQQLLPLLEEKAQWMNHTALVFGREDAGLTNEELALADVLTGVCRWLRIIRR